MRVLMLLFSVKVLLTIPNYAQISGKVNLSSSGSFSKTISIKAINSSGSIVSQTQSSVTGTYSLSVPSGEKVRLVFGDGSIQASTASTRFVCSPQSNVDFNVSDPQHYVIGSAFIASPVYIQGSGNTTAWALVAQPLAGGGAVCLATAAQVGSLWGVAFEDHIQQLYSASFAKRHVGYGPLGPGGIYRTDWKTRQTFPYVDLASLGIPVGKDHHDSLTTDLLAKSIDAGLMADVGTMSLGGIDVFEGKLFVMNLSNQTLYAITLPTDVNQKPSASDVTAYPLPNPGCTGGVARPFAVKAHEGKIYVGLVCDASTSQLTSNLNAFVYALDIAKKSFKEVLSLPLDYPRGEVVKGLNVKSWYAWSNDFSKALHASLPSTATRPQPILSSLAFDSEGSLILGFMDRFGHQSGTGQPDPSGLASYSGIAAGDLLKVYARNPEKSKAHYQIEANGRVGKLQSLGVANGQGPKGGEFFFEDFFKDANEQVLHEETGAGGVVILPATDEVLITAHEPTTQFNTGGIKALSNKQGKANRGWDLYENGQLGTFGKANGVGGLTVVGQPAEISIGDRLWLDANEDGIQDPNENPLSGIKLDLYQQGQLVASTVSDKNGEYSFKGDYLKSHTDYEIRVSLQEHALHLSKSKAGPDEDLDSDGTEVSGYAVIKVQTKGAGQHLYHYDLGFLCASKPDVQPLWSHNAKSGESYLLLSNYQATYQYEWLENETWAGFKNYTQAKSIPEHGLIFTNHGATAGKEYRLRVMDEKGCYTEQFLRTPSFNHDSSPVGEGWLVVYPNPVLETLRVKMPARNEKAKLQFLTLDGKVLFERGLENQQGQYQTSITLPNLPAGQYVIRVEENGIIQTAIAFKTL